MKKLFVCLGVAVALLVGCDGGSNGALNGPQGGFSYATVDDLPNCSGTREGEVALVESNSTANLCTGGIWHNIGASVATEDALLNCSPNREGSKVYVMESARSLFCTDGRWVEYESGSSSNNGIASSSSYAISSSSSAKQSSSSEAVAEVMPSGTYDCDTYNCVSTTYLKSGITYGEILDTRDNQVYRTIKIGTQTWMAQNLNIATEGTKCAYDDDPCEGRQYTWEAAQTVCPAGWHLPSRKEFGMLLESVGSNAQERSVNLRSLSWANGQDKFGFSALPDYYNCYDKKFSYLGGCNARFWSSTEYNEDCAYFLYIDYNIAGDSGQEERFRYSVRCLKDN